MSERLLAKQAERPRVVGFIGNDAKLEAAFAITFCKMNEMC